MEQLVVQECATLGHHNFMLPFWHEEVNFLHCGGITVEQKKKKIYFGSMRLLALWRFYSESEERLPPEQLFYFRVIPVNPSSQFWHSPEAPYRLSRQMLLQVIRQKLWHEFCSNLLHVKFTCQSPLAHTILQSHNAANVTDHSHTVLKMIFSSYFSLLAGGCPKCSVLTNICPFLNQLLLCAT